MPEDSAKPSPPSPPAAQPGIPETSMEEIIASIGRVIAADSRAPSPARAGEAGGRGILELTEAIEPDGSIRKLTGASPSAVAGPPIDAATPAAEPPSQPAAPGNAAGRVPPAPLLSAAVSEAAAASLGRLGTPRERPAEPEASPGSGGRTLEAVVRDALDPLLRAWLDEHLPDIVERLVRAEIQRVARDAGLR